MQDTHVHCTAYSLTVKVLTCSARRSSTAGASDLHFGRWVMTHTRVGHVSLVGLPLSIDRGIFSWVDGSIATTGRCLTVCNAYEQGLEVGI